MATRLSFSVAKQPRHGRVIIDRTTGEGRYVPRENWYGNDSFVYRVSDGRLSDTGTIVVNAHPVNDAPAFGSAALTREVAFNAVPDSAVDTPVQAWDPDGDQILYGISDSNNLFTIDAGTGQIRVAEGSVINHQLGSTIEVTITATDVPAPVDSGPITPITVETTVTIEVVEKARRTAQSVVVPGGGFAGFAGLGGLGGGGGGGDEPTPSTVDFEWTVARDIEELAAGNSAPTGLWSDGSTAAAPRQRRGAPATRCTPTTRRAASARRRASSGWTRSTAPRAASGPAAGSPGSPTADATGSSPTIWPAASA